MNPDTKRPPVFRPVMPLPPYAEPGLPTPPVEVLPPNQPNEAPALGASARYPSPDAEGDALRALAALGYSLSAALAWWVVSDIISALSGRKAP